VAQSSPTGSIYDLGYRPYEGERLGRAYAIQSLFFYSLRSIFGLGRSAGAKVFPFALAVIALLPALVQIAIAAIAPEDFEFISHEDHFGYVSTIIALFCCVAAPDISGRDQRSRTLTLYFSRALSRADYVTAKLAAMVTAIFIVTIIPQILLMLGNAIATNNVTDYLGDNAGDVPPILGSSIMISLVMGSVALAIAVQSNRRVIATIAVLGYFIISLAVSEILVETITGSGRGLSILLSPTNTLDGLSVWFFGATPDFDSTLGRADNDGFVYLLGSVAYILLACAILYRRYQRMSV
jgi:ABC-2 type transport system permease protein